jgi:hypothetical protein
LLDWTLHPPRSIEFFASLQIMQENPLHLQGKLSLIDKGGNFEIMLETAKIHIGRPDTGDGVV